MRIDFKLTDKVIIFAIVKLLRAHEKITKKSIVLKVREIYKLYGVNWKDYVDYFDIELFDESKKIAGKYWVFS